MLSRNCAKPVRYRNSHHVRLEEFAKARLTHPESSLCFFLFRHIQEVRWKRHAQRDSSGIRTRCFSRFRIEVVEVARNAGFYRRAVLPAKLRLRCMRKKFPLRPANHLARPQSHDPRRLLIHIGVSALLVQNHQPIGGALQHDSSGLQRWYLARVQLSASP